MNDKLLYHYTSVETLFKLFQNIDKNGGNLIFRANYFMNMNDPLDCRYLLSNVSQILSEGKEECRTEIEKQLEKAINDVGLPYFISFSSAKDNLPMWKMYGDNAHGVSIGFSAKKLQEAVDNFQSVGDTHHRALMKYCFCHQYECKYWGREQIQKDFVEKYNIKIDKNNHIQGLTTKDICATTSIFKSPDFGYEEESRVVLLYSQNKKIGPQYFDFFVPVSSIEKIICGPCTSKEYVRALLPPELRDCVEESKVPYTDTPRKIRPVWDECK